MPETSIQQETQSTWALCRDPVLLTMVGGAIDTIGFIALFSFFTAHVTGNLVLAGAAFVKGGAGIWIKLAAIPLFIVTVMITKLLIDRSQVKHKTLSYLFLFEAIFLCAFMFAGLYFETFKDPDSITVALTGGLGLIALAIRNTSSKTLIKNISPSTMMTGNTTQLGIDIANLLKNNDEANRISLIKSASIVIGFVVGAFLGAILYVYFDFWCVAPFILPIFYFSYLSSQQKFNQA